jgi:hypothetical protein
MKILVFIISFLGIIFPQNDDDLTYQHVVHNQLNVLIPKNLTKSSPKKRKAISSSSPSLPDPTDFYCNADSSQKIIFAELGQAGAIKDVGHIMDIMVMGQASKIYSHGIESVNGNEVYIAKYDIDDIGKDRKSLYADLFVINSKRHVISIMIYCDEKIKTKWLPISEKILRSIKLN